MPVVDVVNPAVVVSPKVAERLRRLMSMIGGDPDTIVTEAEPEPEIVEEKPVVRGFAQPEEPINFKKRIDYSDFERVIRTTYNHIGKDSSDVFRYSFQADLNGAPNDSTHEYEVTGEWSDYDEEEMALWHKRGYANSTMAGRLLNDLCRRKLIKKGMYYIRLSY